MSLINEALKKAQTARTTATDAPLVQAVASSKVRGIGLYLGAALLLLSTAGTAYWIYANSQDKPPVTVPGKPPVTVTGKPPVTVTVLGKPPVTVPGKPVDPVVDPVVADPVDPPVVNKPPELGSDKPAVHELGSNKSAVHADAQIVAFIKAMHISGVRIEDKNSRILVKERIFFLNEIVDIQLNIRLVKVMQGIVMFEDANGVTYVKHQ